MQCSAVQWGAVGCSSNDVFLQKYILPRHSAHIPAQFREPGRINRWFHHQEIVEPVNIPIFENIWSFLNL
jgi:hypothetical protein